MTGFEEQDTDLFLCDTNTCKFDGECLRIGDTVTCICDFKVGISAPHTFASFISTTCWRCDIVKGITTRGVSKLSQIRINLHMPSHKKHAHILSLGHGQRAPLVLRHRASVSCCRPSCITQANSIICLLAQCRGGGISFDASARSPASLGTKMPCALKKGHAALISALNTIERH